MLRDQVHLFSVMPADRVPEWVHLVPAGTFRGIDGRGPYTLADPEAVITLSMQGAAPFSAGGKLPIDENHSIDRAMTAGGSSPARGWIVELQARSDGIWGKVEWTPTGQALLAEKAYRGLSPALVLQQGTGRVSAIARASLVNTPNLTALTTLHSRNEDHMDFIVQARAALGLPAEADASAVLAAITAQKTELATHSAASTAIAKAVGLATDAAPAAIAQKVELQLQGANTEEATLRSTVIALQSQVGTMEQATRRAAAEAYVDGAIRNGKPILPLRDHYISRHMADPASVEKEISAQVSIHSGGAVSPASARSAGSDGLSPDERRICELMGIAPEKFKETRESMKLEAL